MTTQHDHATEHRHVLIIGNGFDLEHRFNTRYGDFAKWLEDNEYPYYDNVWSRHVVNVYRKNMSTHDQKTWIDLEKEIERLITSLSKDSTILFPSIVPFDCMMFLLLDSYDFVDYHKRYIKLIDIAYFIRDPDNTLRLDDYDYMELDDYDYRDLISIYHAIQAKPDLLECYVSKLHNENNRSSDWYDVSPQIILSFLKDCSRTVTWQTFKEWRENNSEWSELNITIFDEEEEKDLPHILFQTEKDFIDFLYWQLERLIAQFDSYLQSVFEGVDVQTVIKEHPFRLNHLVKPDHPPIEYDPIQWEQWAQWAWSTTNVVSFNYTRTYQAIGKERYPNVTAIDDQVIHIHGQMSLHDQMGQNNMVLGTRTMDHPGSTEWHRFHKHTQRMVKDTISRYQDLLADMKKAHKVTIGVVGHSLDTSDHAILKHLLMANPNTRVRAYYHSTDHLVAMNQHITTIMGEDAVTEKVRFIYQYDHHDDGSKNKDGVFETKTGVAVGV